MVVTNKKSTWIVVADGARARFLKKSKTAKLLENALDYAMVASHAPNREIGADRPGRKHDSAGPGSHEMGRSVDWHQYEKTKFAKSVADVINKAAAKQQFDRLIVVAPPKTQGDLRAALSRQAQDAIHAEVTKDLTNLSLSALAERLKEELAP